MSETYVIFWRPEGPLIRYVDGALCLEDLNPETKMKWLITAEELREIGGEFIKAAAVAEIAGSGRPCNVCGYQVYDRLPIRRKSYDEGKPIAESFRDTFLDGGEK
jgi:hypothetical protein